MTPSAESFAPGAPELLVCALDHERIPTSRYRGLLSSEERRRIDAVRHPDARRRSLVARAMLRLELAERLDCRPEAVTFTFGVEGKPGLADGDAWHFNLSHSGDRIVLALASSAPVGVDVESCQRRSRIEALARHYFGDDEQAELALLDANSRRAHFFRLWTLKEAVTKALGHSLWRTLAGIRVTGAPPNRPRLSLDHDIRCDVPITWWHWQTDDHYSLAAVHLGPASAAPRISLTLPGHWHEPLALELSSSGVWTPDFEFGLATDNFSETNVDAQNPEALR